MKPKRTAIVLLVLFLVPFSISSQTKQELNDQLFEAVRAGNAATVTALLDKGADVNAKFRYGTTALFKAAERGHVEVTKILLARGADVTVKDTFYGSNALSWALQNDHVEVVRAILAKDTASVDEVLMSGARAGTVALVEIALAQGGAKPETLTAALAATMNDKEKAAIAEMLKKAGAVPPPEIDAATLQSYAGNYKSERGTIIAIALNAGKLSAQVTGQPPIPLFAVDKTSFKPTTFGGLLFTMNLEGEKVVGFTLKQGASNTIFKRIE